MKQKVLFYTFFILLFLALQSTLLNYAAIFGVTPDILMVFVIVTALLRGNIEGGAVGFFAGFALDMMFGNVLGFYALLGLYLGIAAGSLNRRLFRENLLVVIFFTFIYSVIYEILVYVLHNIIGGNIRLFYSITEIILPKAAYNCIAAILIYPLLMKAGKHFAGMEKPGGKY